MPRTKAEPQVSMDDRWLEDPELEAELDEREELKEGRDEYNAKDKSVKARIQAHIDAGALEVGGSVRVGPYKLSLNATPGGERSFETKPGQRVAISKVGGD